MKILVIWRVESGVSNEDIEPLLVDEERFAWRSYTSDILREAYGSDLPTPVIMVVEAESIDWLKTYYEELPLLKAGLISGEYYPLRPFRSWELLFREEEQLVLGRQADG